MCIRYDVNMLCNNEACTIEDRECQASTILYARGIISTVTILYARGIISTITILYARGIISTVTKLIHISLKKNGKNCLSSACYQDSKQHVYTNYMHACLISYV